MKRSKLDTHTKNAINYFKKSDSLTIIGGILLVAGFLCLWLGWSFSFIGYLLGTLCTPTGLVLFLVGSVGRVTDDHIESFISNKMAGLDIDIDSNRSYQLKLLKNYKEITVEGYRYHDGVMIKRLKSGELRTSEFSRSKIRILKDRLYILNREISLIYDDQVTNNIFEPTYDKIISAEIVREQKSVTFNKSSFLTKPCYLTITTVDSIISLPCIDAITSDEIVRNIMKQRKIYVDSLQVQENSSI